MTSPIKFTIPEGTPISRCRSLICGREIYWVKTATHRNMPVDPDGTPHWATCAEATKFKRGRK